jgi:hypothetical protein
MEEQKDLQASPEQVTYGNVLEIGMYIGLAVLFITFIIYVFGILDPYIPLDKVADYWSMSVTDYLHKADIHAGWTWLGKLGYSDFLNFIGVAILAGVTIVCYLTIIPILLRNNDKVYAILALLEVVVLVSAASGLIGAGH